ncbi:hypothetical protein NMY22_g1514 [Coprinellus aureogranulatus]|nr:hypothetical protein NMY22_g1514 [Coprinellus aureogranulatus]
MESPFQAYLDTNYVPLDSDRVHIEQLLQGPLQQVREINAELEDLQRRFQALTGKKEEHERFIARHRALLNPVRILPDEILRAIFDRCVPEDQPFPPNGVTNCMSVEKAPLLLTFVCQRWREVALDYHALWAAPYISIPRSTSRGPQGESDDERTLKFAQFVGLWLSRALHMPLQLTVTSPKPPLTFKQHQHIWKAISLYSKQWRFLRVHVTNELLDTILSMPSSAVPILNLLQISLVLPWRATEAARLYGAKNLIGGASIQAFCIHGEPWIPPQGHSPLLMHIPLHWRQLTHLHILSINLSDKDVLSIFKKATSLQGCSITIDSFGLQDRFPSTPDLNLPDLTYWSIITTGKLTGILSHLSLPNLRVVALVTQEEGPDSLIAIAQKSFGLVSLNLQSRSITTAQLLQCLALTPRLERLSINSLTGSNAALATDELLTSLTPPLLEDRFNLSSPLCSPPRGCHTGNDGEVPLMAGSTFLCPNLVTLDLNITFGQGVSDRALYTFIKRRRELPKRINSLRAIFMMDNRRDPEMDVIEELQKQAVDISEMTIDLEYRKRDSRWESYMDQFIEFGGPTAI